MHRGQQQGDRLKLGKALDAVNNNKNYKRYEEIIESRDDEIKTLEQKCKAYEKEIRNLHKSVQQHEDDQIKRENADKELLNERVVMQTKMDSQDDEHRLRVEEVEKTWKQNLADATAKGQKDNSQLQADKRRWEEKALEGERQHKECKGEKEDLKFKAKDALQKLKQEKTKSKQSEGELQQMKVDLYTSVQLIWDLPSFKTSIIALHKRYCDDKTCKVMHQDSSTAEALRKAVWDTHNMVEVEKMNKKKEIKEMILKMEDNDKRTSENLKIINEAMICALEQHQKPKHSMELPKQIPSDSNETIKAPQAETSSLEEQLQKPEESARKEKLPKKTFVQKCMRPIRDSCRYTNP
ncbi:hypothetical protein EYF80_063928 [Liparis tanakae]|uniref:Uncharacterized protein n=1 Tax=Liparis tanakae TaxID=230148 RepID=A0A4Z2EAS3_9TELE|nr:hypothetical protein EYF80_063928 [Liparis tanakae]